MKNTFRQILTLAGVAFVVGSAPGMAEVRRIEIDVAGYLCGL